MADLVAPTPQAKGKIERRFGTFQRRLVTLLANARAQTWRQSDDVLQMEIGPTQRKTVTLILHPRRRFWIFEHPPKNAWPTILGQFTL